MMSRMATPADKSARQRLAEHVIQRRTQLGMNKVDVARAADITITTYGNIEAGTSVRDTTYGKVEPVLGWAAGSCRDVLRGGTPTLAEASANGAVISPYTEADLENIGQVLQNAAISVTGLPAPEIRKMKQRVLDELRRQGELPDIDRD